MQTAERIVRPQVIAPAPERDLRSQNPTQIRYGWCPYGDINLAGPDGTINLYVQPHEIAGPDGEAMENPYHRKLPQGQLIPFPTFNVISQMPDPDRTDTNGRAILISSTSTRTALEAASSVLWAYSRWGFTILSALQGLDQDVAHRIFSVVQPFVYPLSELMLQLGTGALDRIESREPMILNVAQDVTYEIEPLASDFERERAMELREQMMAGAQISFDLASETIDGTMRSMTSRASGGKGKDGPDALDRRLSEELGRDLPHLVGNDQKQAELAQKIDYLVGRQQAQEDREEIERLRAKVAALEAGTAAGDSLPRTVETAVTQPVGSESQENGPQGEETASIGTCGFIKADGNPCKSMTRNGERCFQHKGADAEDTETEE